MSNFGFYLYYPDFISVLKILYYNEISDLSFFAERTKFIDISLWKYGWREMHLRFRFNCSIHYHDLAERGTNPLTRREELGILREEKRLALMRVLFAMQWQIRFVSTNGVFWIYSLWSQYLGILVNKWWRVVCLKGSTHFALLHARLCASM